MGSAWKVQEAGEGLADAAAVEHEEKKIKNHKRKHHTEERF